MIQGTKIIKFPLDFKGIVYWDLEASLIIHQLKRDLTAVKLFWLWYFASDKRVDIYSMCQNLSIDKVSQVSGNYPFMASKTRESSD